MANLITTSLTYSKESATEYFFKPLFIESDLMQECTVMTDIKSSKKLNEISTLSGITKAYAQGASFTASTGATITQRTLTVVDLKAEVKQNGKAFKDFVGQELLKKGWAENDVIGTEFEKIVAELFMRAIKKDLQSLIWLADTNAELQTTGAKNGTVDTHLASGVTGLWTRIIADVKAGTIAATQRVTMVNGAVAQVATVSVTGTTGTAGTCNITVMGKTYLVTKGAGVTAATACTNFVTSHAAALLARGVVVAAATADLVFTSSIEGVSIGLVAISAALTGDTTGTAVATTANTAPAALGTDEALTAFEAMRKAAPNEMLENKDMLRIYATRSFVENYKESLQAVGAGEQAYTATVDGVARLTWDGIPIIEKASWDTIIAANFGNAYPHRALMTYPEALIIGTDGDGDALNVELFYDAPTQENYFRAEYKLGTQYRDDKYIVAAY